MQRDFSALSRQRFDLAIIGGGVNGAATARDAALRGLQVALVEGRDFASGTSSRSSKLIHGGLRYLEQFDFKLVHESRTERRTLLHLAPHLARPLPFVLPIYRSDPYFPLKIRAGLTLYDLLGSLGPADRHRMLSRGEALKLIPALQPKGLRAAALYYDSETDDARLTIEMLLGAAEHGAVVANYARVHSFRTAASGEVVSAEVEDVLTGRRVELAARYWVNATGPWVDRVRGLLPDFDGTTTVRLTKGTHLVLPQVDGTHALFAAIPADGRIFLMLPWHGHALLGTTDTDYTGDPAAVQPDSADTDYLLAAVNRVLRRAFEPKDVVGSFAGLRALAVEPGRSASANTREYRFHSEPGTANFLSICGGKLTTARALGEKLVGLVGARLGAALKPVRLSRTTLLPGGNTGSFEEFVVRTTQNAVKKFGVPAPTAERVVRTYGSRWERVLELLRERPAQAESLPGDPSLLAAEVRFAAREEMAANVEDFLVRRSGLNWLAACTLTAAAPAVAQILAEELMRITE